MSRTLYFKELGGWTASEEHDLEDFVDHKNESKNAVLTTGKFG